MTEAIARELVVLPPVADDPVFTEALPERTTGAARTLGNDPHDFAALYMRHRWSFALHARRFLSDQRDIDEVVQEGFLKLFLAMPELETELQALAYARRTITNLCIDRYRADQRRPRLVDLESVRIDDLPEDDELDPVVAAEDAAIVREALALLSPLHREALIKREVEEKSLPQIAVELDLPVDQVKHVLHRARRSLRRLLIGTYVEPGVDLDLAAVLAANRARAAAAAKPTGAAVIALLLVLAGVIGLRSSQSGGNTTVAGDVPRGLAPDLGTDPTQPHGVVGLAPAPVATVSHTPLSRPTHATGSTATPVTPATRPVTHKPIVTPPVTPPVSSPPPATGTGGPVSPPSDNFVLLGMGKTAAVQVSDQQRDLRPAGTVSSSLLTATTADGAYSLQQALTFTPAGELDQVTLNEAIPLASGDSVGTTVHHTSTTSALLTDGSIQVQTTGTASPLGDVNGVTAPTRTVMVTIVLAADRVQVVQEKVTIAPAPAPAPAPLPTATPESTPTSGSGTPDAPAPDPTLPPDPSGSAVGAPGLPVVVEDPTAR